MAVVKSLMASQLQLQVVKDTDAKGSPVLGKITYSNIKTAAAEQDLYDVGIALGGLQQYPLYGVLRINTNQLINE